MAINKVKQREIARVAVEIKIDMMVMTVTYEPRVLYEYKWMSFTQVSIKNTAITVEMI